MSKRHTELGREPGLRFALLTAHLFLAACTGSIGGAGGPEEGVVDPNKTPDQVGEKATGSSGLRFARLSGLQWKHSVLQLFQLPASTPVSLPQETLPHFTFDTSQPSITVPSTVLTGLRDAVESLVVKVAPDDTSLQAFVPAGTPVDTTARAEAVAGQLLLRAFRRPPTADELAKYKGYILAGAGGNDNEKLRAGLRAALQIAAQSPHFLSRVELADNAKVIASPVGGRVRLTGYELATRLSLALYDVAPDDAMLSDAKAGRFDDDAGLAAQVDKALADPRSRAAILRFHEQMYSTDEYAGLSKDAAKFPLFKAGVGTDMREDMLRTVGNVIDEGGGVRELLSTRTGYLNARLAPLYGRPSTGLNDNDFVKTELPAERAGVLSRVGWLAWSAGPVERRPILRGVVMLNNVLCERTSGSPPPPAEPTYPVNIVTNRQRIEFATKDCMGCHAAINSKGFAFQHFDASGAFVAEDNGKPADASVEFMLDGASVKVDGSAAMFEKIAASRQAQTCYAKRWTAYLIGYADSTLEDKIAAGLADEAAKRRVSVREIARTILLSDAFTTRKITEAP